MHARTLELLDARGMAEALIPLGVSVYEVAPPDGAMLDLRELPGRYAMLLIVPQSGTEQVLEGRAAVLVHVTGGNPEIPDAVLVRPDGYVAWASDRVPSAAELAAAVDNWVNITTNR